MNLIPKELKLEVKIVLLALVLSSVWLISIKWALLISNFKIRWVQPAVV